MVQRRIKREGRAGVFLVRLEVLIEEAPELGQEGMKFHRIAGDKRVECPSLYLVFKFTGWRAKKELPVFGKKI